MSFMRTSDTPMARAASSSSRMASHARADVRILEPAVDDDDCHHDEQKRGK